jgi:hypothetical protein
MKSIYTYSYCLVLSVAFILASVLSGCDDNVVGVEGFCPVVESTNPLNLATDVSPNTIITVTFEEKINPATMIPSAFTLTAATMVQSVALDFSAGDEKTALIYGNANDNMAKNHAERMPESRSSTMAVQNMEPEMILSDVSGSMTFDNASTTMTFTPESPLSPNTVYTGRVIKTVEDPIGNRMLEDYVWSFTTAGTPATVPVITSTFPQNGDENIEMNAIISATFNQTMNPTSLNPVSFTLFNGTTQINGSVSYSNLTASFVPDNALAAETTFTATVTTGAQSNMGIALANNIVWTFTTNEAGVIASPTVVSTLPQDGAADVARNIIVSATFSQVMSPATLNQSTFTLFDGNTQIDGSVSYTNLTASFVPDSELSAETTYTATITTGAENETGTGIENDFVWEFTTEEAQTPPPLLGLADSYGIMATAAITNTGGTIINGDVSLDPGTSITGFPPGIINGDLNINNTESAEAKADLLVAYNYFKGLPPGITVAAGADLGALYPNGIAPGTYTSGSTMLVSTTLVLDAGGDVNAVWVFQIGSSLTTGADVVLTNGANENNVYWVMTEDATIGVGTTFHGTLVSGRDVTANTGAIINGRILAGAINAGTIALDNNTVNVPGF